VVTETPCHTGIAGSVRGVGKVVLVLALAGLAGCVSNVASRYTVIAAGCPWVG
jgi:hypothetical protein